MMCGDSLNRLDLRMKRTRFMLSQLLRRRVLIHLRMPYFTMRELGTGCILME